MPLLIDTECDDCRRPYRATAAEHNKTEETFGRLLCSTCRTYATPKEATR